MREIALIALLCVTGCGRIVGDGNPAGGFAVAETESYLVRVYAPRSIKPMIETPTGIEAYPDELLVVRVDVTLKDPVRNSDIVSVSGVYDTGILHPDFAKGGLKVDGYNRAESEMRINTEGAFPVLLPIIASDAKFTAHGPITVTVTSAATGKTESATFEPIYDDSGVTVRRLPRA